MSTLKVFTSIGELKAYTDGKVSHGMATPEGTKSDLYEWELTISTEEIVECDTNKNMISFQKRKEC